MNGRKRDFRVFAPVAFFVEGFCQQELPLERRSISFLHLFQIASYYRLLIVLIFYIQNAWVERIVSCFAELLI